MMDEKYGPGSANQVVFENKQRDVKVAETLLDKLTKVDFNKKISSFYDKAILEFAKQTGFIITKYNPDVHFVPMQRYLRFRRIESIGQVTELVGNRRDAGTELGITTNENDILLTGLVKHKKMSKDIVVYVAQTMLPTNAKDFRDKNTQYSPVEHVGPAYGAYEITILGLVIIKSGIQFTVELNHFSMVDSSNINPPEPNRYNAAFQDAIMISLFHMAIFKANDLSLKLYPNNADTNITFGFIFMLDAGRMPAQYNRFADTLSKLSYVIKLYTTKTGTTQYFYFIRDVRPTYNCGFYIPTNDTEIGPGVLLDVLYSYQFQKIGLFCGKDPLKNYSAMLPAELKDRLDKKLCSAGASFSGYKPYGIDMKYTNNNNQLASAFYSRRHYSELSSHLPNKIIPYEYSIFQTSPRSNYASKTEIAAKQGLNALDRSLTPYNTDEKILTTEIDVLNSSLDIVSKFIENSIPLGMTFKIDQVYSLDPEAANLMKNADVSLKRLEGSESKVAKLFNTRLKKKSYLTILLKYILQMAQRSQYSRQNESINGWLLFVQNEFGRLPITKYFDNNTNISYYPDNYKLVSTLYRYDKIKYDRYVQQYARIPRTVSSMDYENSLLREQRGSEQDKEKEYGPPPPLSPDIEQQESPVILPLRPQRPKPEPLQLEPQPQPQQQQQAAQFPILPEVQPLTEAQRMQQALQQQQQQLQAQQAQLQQLQQSQQQALTQERFNQAVDAQAYQLRQADAERAAYQALGPPQQAKSQGFNDFDSSGSGSKQSSFLENILWLGKVFDVSQKTKPYLEYLKLHSFSKDALLDVAKKMCQISKEDETKLRKLTIDGLIKYVKKCLQCEYLPFLCEKLLLSNTPSQVKKLNYNELRSLCAWYGVDTTCESPKSSSKRHCDNCVKNVVKLRTNPLFQRDLTNYLSLNK